MTLNDLERRNGPYFALFHRIRVQCCHKTIITPQIEVDDMQFEFMKAKGTTYAIFTVRQVQENFRIKGKELYFGFVDLEKLLIGFQEK